MISQTAFQAQVMYYSFAAVHPAYIYWYFEEGGVVLLKRVVCYFEEVVWYFVWYFEDVDVVL